MSRPPSSPDAPRDTKRDRQQTTPGATEPSKTEGGKAGPAFEVTETPAPSAGKPALQRKPGPPPGLVAQLMLGFAVLAAAAGTYLVLKLPKAAPSQLEAARPVPAATGSATEPSRERPPR